MRSAMVLKLMGACTLLLAATGDTPSQQRKPSIKLTDPSDKRMDQSSLGRDPRLRRARLTVMGRPDFHDLIRRLQAETELPFSIAPHLERHDPDLGEWTMPNTQTWVIMNTLADLGLEDGHWIRTADGYRLNATRSLRERPPPPPAGVHGERPAPAPAGVPAPLADDSSWWQRLVVIVPSILVVFVLVVGTFVLLRSRRSLAANGVPLLLETEEAKVSLRG
jgi:hypothetical protein